MKHLTDNNLFTWQLLKAAGLNLRDLCVYLKREEIHTQIMTSPFAFIDK